jgi:hypothetical protein
MAAGPTTPPATEAIAPTFEPASIACLRSCGVIFAAAGEASSFSAMVVAKSMRGIAATAYAPESAVATTKGNRKRRESAASRSARSGDVNVTSNKPKAEVCFPCGPLYAGGCRLFRPPERRATILCSNRGPRELSLRPAWSPQLRAADLLLTGPLRCVVIARSHRPREAVEWALRRAHRGYPLR